MKFEDKIIDILKKSPCDTITLSHRLGEGISPVSSTLEHLKKCDKIELFKDKWQMKK
jgi:hypothetical protein|tara:strand:+ start:222 stop:392 length:171 start_codon:yes stop_codon:yes gene_type:complete